MARSTVVQGLALVQPGASFSVGTVVSSLMDFMTSVSLFSVFACALTCGRQFAFKASCLTLKPNALTQAAGTVGPTEAGKSGAGRLVLSLGLLLGVCA